MSVVIPAMKKTRWPLLAAGVTVAVLTALWIFAPQRVTIGAGRGATGDRAIPQAAWEVKAYPAPGAEGVTKETREAFAREREAVIGRIQELYEALFLKPEAVDRVVRSALTRDASKTLAGSRLGLHAQVEDVRTTKRFVKVGIQIDGGRRAAAVVLVEARALRDSSPIKVWHRAKLWMEKGDSGWKVVAFDGEQGRLP